MTIDQTSGVKTLDKLVTILDSFSNEQPAWSLAALSRELSIPKASLHRLLSALEHHDLLQRSAEDERWRLGYRLFSWGSRIPEISALRLVARPIVRQLATDSGETAILTIADEHEVVCVDKEESRHPVRLTMEIGARRPLHAGASSKILLAHLPETRIQAIIQASGLPRLGVNTITDEQALQQELDLIRKQGYALSFEETDQGAWGTAVPIEDSGGRILASIGVAGPLSRHTDERTHDFIRLCKQASAEISALI